MLSNQELSSSLATRNHAQPTTTSRMLICQIRCHLNTYLIPIILPGCGSTQARGTGKQQPLSLASLFLIENPPRYRSPNTYNSPTPMGETLFIIRIFLFIWLSQFFSQQKWNFLMVKQKHRSSNVLMASSLLMA